LPYWKVDDILMIFRYIMGQGREETFNKRLLELEILQWMPFKQVRRLYQVWPLI